MASFREGWALGRRVAETTHHFIKDSEIHQRSISHKHTAVAHWRHTALKSTNHIAERRGEKRPASICRTETQKMRRQHLLHPSTRAEPASSCTCHRSYGHRHSWLLWALLPFLSSPETLKAQRISPPLCTGALEISTEADDLQPAAVLDAAPSGRTLLWQRPENFH